MFQHASEYERGRMDGAHDRRNLCGPRMVAIDSEPQSQEYRDGYRRGQMEEMVNGDRLSKQMMAAYIERCRQTKTISIN